MYRLNHLVKLEIFYGLFITMSLKNSFLFLSQRALILKCWRAEERISKRVGTLNGGESKMNWRVYITDHTKKQLKRFPIHDIRRIEHAIDSIEENPFYGDIEKLGGEMFVWRRRVGGYRIKYEMYKERKLVIVYDIERRTTSTY